MEEIIHYFDENPLPFSYMTFPYLEDPARPRHPTHLFFVNNVIAELTARFFNRSGLPHTENKRKWNISWGQQFDPPGYQKCAAWQKINHFAGAYFIGKKSELHNRMKELKEKIGSDVDFYPLSYTTPDDLDELKKKWKDVKLWIEKPVSSSKGIGIKIVSSSESDPPSKGDPEKYVVQQYIEKPLLINNRHKFDIRLYALVTSIAPLRIYLHEYGLARFATHEYNSDINDLHSQLTNISINREDSNFSVQQQKLSLQQLYEMLEKDGIDTSKLKSEFDRITTSCLVAAASKIRPYHQSLIKHRQTSFELFGLDVLVDENLHCWVMEVNISPSMSGKDSELDRIQKNAIMAEMYNIGKIINCDPNSENPCEAVELYDAEWRNSIVSIDRSKETPWDWKEPIFADMVNVGDFIDERKQLRKFRRLFPKRKTIDYFEKFFGKMGYLDRSFIEWIKMSNDKRLDAIKRGGNVYTQTLKMIESKLLESKT
ncbi:Tubulin-tyrosine ligase family protein [Tritrichomonas foetus]|uniref:Tubulin--tyrosine ligase-like protein 5 n=1 Tax=Tritrichomonas foetus TaxID=1144522 RepID=A0A1J4KKD7_9EUKA|nr:Tubulin-tyrosine ligase family protein [Tritrichomonas foetus]|eukprot:OHT10300.1 Tubulin-tyrosine ligase family protein [Tritrichomonas foetus]